MDDARRRAWEALELGPLWRSRETVPPIADDAGAASAGDPASASPGAPGRPQVIATVAAAAPAPPSGLPPQPTPMPMPAEAGVSSPVAALDWAGLRAAVESCRACGLCRTRNRTVFGAGPEQARWLVVGEGPGAEEDASGDPFVGQAGRLLDAMLAAIDLDRARNVFIANVVKCRPPGNRNPLPDETAACLPFLHRQIELLAPDFVLLLGRVAAHALLATDAGVGSLRGRLHRLSIGGRDIPAVVTWHPSYLLRRPEDKALAWADLCRARAAFEANG